MKGTPSIQILGILLLFRLFKTQTSDKKINKETASALNNKV